jgi:putative transposase
VSRRGETSKSLHSWPDDSREKVENWRREYNEVRPHSAIGDRAPMSLIHQPQHGPEADITPESLINWS